MKFVRAFIVIFLLVSCFIDSSLISAPSGRISGLIKDSTTGDPLPGANIQLVGTALGAATDQNGEYHIFRIPPGTYMLRITFIGYKQREIEVQVSASKEEKVNVDLNFDVVEGETVTITAQAEGQVAAINQQLRSNTITNVVSAERIQELPDANAAESVGRLPGVSIKRDGGEGNKIVIRGLAPTYNTITIGGEKVPATDLDDRSVDLNMISPEILAGIEVTKALTPDKDADAFGGIVNFKLATAPKGGFRYNFRLQEGYNAQRDESGQYKGSMTLSNRYWDEKLGLMITGNMERAQRGSDRFTAEYGKVREKREGEDRAPYSATNVNLQYVDEVRKRLGFSVLMDYEWSRGKLMFSNFMSRLDRDENIRYNRYMEEGNFHELRFRDRQRQIDVLTNTLSAEHQLYFGMLDWRISRTASLTRHPFDSYLRARELAAFDRLLIPDPFDADELINAAYHDYDNMSLYQIEFNSEKAYERDQSAQFNMQIPYTLTNNVAGFVKFGGKYVNKMKERDREYRLARLDNAKYPLDRHHSQYGEPGFEYQTLPTKGWPSIYNYLDSDFNSGNFLGGDYDFGPALDGGELRYLITTFLLDSVMDHSSYYDLDDYDLTESVSAGYIMSEINFGRLIMFLPGVRYEHTTADMTGRKGLVPDDDTEPLLDKPFIADTTATASFGRWFPMFHLRVRPINWFDIRLAYTKTLSRPRLDWMLPKKKIHGSDKVVTFGRPDLLPQIATNYDVFLSFYSNDIGLLTLGGFYKEIDDLIYERQGHKILNAEKEGYASELQGYVLDQPENNPFVTKLKGWEVEWQTNFRWLPKPFDGIVINANYTHISSETQFPRSLVLEKTIPLPPFRELSVVDTFRVGSMPDQSDDIANVAIGYDKGPFSARLSMLYQGRTLTIVGERQEEDGFTDDLLRMDLSVRYKLTDKIGLFLNWNNITNEPDESFQQTTNYQTDREFYGWTMDFGIGYMY